MNLRLTDAPPAAYQLLMTFTDGTCLTFTVAMYGSILLHDGTLDNDYYRRSASAVDPLAADFPAVYAAALDACKPALSAKAFLATEQRFPGIGNGVALDMLFDAGIHPKRKLATLTAEDRARLMSSLVSVLRAMTAAGGRDTEKDLFGAPGGYITRMSRLRPCCPRCGGDIQKEAYLGGSIYYCPHCQPLM